MNKLLVANWKIQLTHDESTAWLSDHLTDLENTLGSAGNRLVICPSFTVLPHTSTIAVQNVAWGAQDCSFEERGAYTGDVSVLSLKELGCSHVIVGHSERRRNYGDTDERVRDKTQLVLKNGLLPIICIGETWQEQLDGKTYSLLEKQLTLLTGFMRNNEKIHIAYEPVWAIGTGKTPDKTDITQTVLWIKDFIEKRIGSNACTILYGGSVNEQTITEVPMELIDGLLLGTASTDAAALKKIILSC